MEAMEREIKREEDGDAEIKQEPMEMRGDNDTKPDIEVKQEPMSPDSAPSAPTPRIKIEPIAPSQTDKKPKCCKYSRMIISIL